MPNVAFSFFFRTERAKKNNFPSLTPRPPLPPHQAAFKSKSPQMSRERKERTCGAFSWPLTFSQLFSFSIFLSFCWPFPCTLNMRRVNYFVHFFSFGESASHRPLFLRRGQLAASKKEEIVGVRKAHENRERFAFMCVLSACTFNFFCFLTFSFVASRSASAPVTWAG